MWRIQGKDSKQKIGVVRLIQCQFMRALKSSSSQIEYPANLRTRSASDSRVRKSERFSTQKSVSKDTVELQAQIRCQPQENFSRENHLFAIHRDQPAKPEYMRRARMRIQHHKIAAAAPYKFFSC